MAFVGDVIISARELFTDLPQSLGPPVMGSPLTVSVGGPTFPAGTYFLLATQLNAWGESLQSAEATIVVAGPSQILIPLTCSPNATSVRIYFGTVSGAETSYQQQTVFGGAVVITLTNSITGAQSPPLRSTAYLPDSDGPAIGAFAVYRWLNQALAWAAAK